MYSIMLGSLAITHQGTGGESFVSDDSLNTLLNGDAVIDSVANVVVAQTNSQILNVVFAHTEKNQDMTKEIIRHNL